MTPRASEIYFKLLDSKMEKLAAADKLGGYGLGTVLGAAGITGLGTGLLAHSIATQEAEDKARADKLKSFGAGFGGGIATGMAAPSIMGGINKAVGKLNKIVGNQGFMPSDTYGAYAPELGFYPEQY
jgi:hypothetical protein